MKGRIKFFSEKEGYGFIQGEDGIEYYFNIHGIKSFTSVPKMADEATFEASQHEVSSQRGKYPEACNVEIKQAVVSQSTVAKNETADGEGDSRVTCPKCHKKVVPRVVTYKGKPQASYCPFCGAQIKKFAEDKAKEIIISLVIIAFVMILMAASH